MKPISCQQVCRLHSFLLVAVTVFAWIAPSATVAAETVTWHTRARLRPNLDATPTQVMEQWVKWDATRTAMVVCDLWDKHHCPDATARVGRMEPRMNDVLKAARTRGRLIIRCPSDTMDFYKDHPGRKLALAGPYTMAERVRSNASQSF